MVWPDAKQRSPIYTLDFVLLAHLMHIWTIKKNHILYSWNIGAQTTLSGFQVKLYNVKRSVYGNMKHTDDALTVFETFCRQLDCALHHVLTWDAKSKNLTSR